MGRKVLQSPRRCLLFAAASSQRDTRIRVSDRVVFSTYNMFMTITDLVLRTWPRRTERWDSADLTCRSLAWHGRHERQNSLAEMPAASPPEKQTSQDPASRRRPAPPRRQHHAPSTPPSTPPPALRAPVLAVLKKFPACGELFYAGNFSAAAAGLQPGMHDELYSGKAAQAA
jgi:hypothetical protein